MEKYGGFKNFTVFMEVFPKHLLQILVLLVVMWKIGNGTLTFYACYLLGTHVIFTVILWERYYKLLFTDEKTVGHED